MLSALAAGLDFGHRPLEGHRRGKRRQRVIAVALAIRRQRRVEQLPVVAVPLVASDLRRRVDKRIVSAVATPAKKSNKQQMQRSGVIGS